MSESDLLSKVVFLKKKEPPIREVGYEKILLIGDSSEYVSSPFWMRRCPKESKVSESM